MSSLGFCEGDDLMWTVLIYGQLMCVNSINFIDALQIPVESEDDRFYLSVKSSLTPFKGQSSVRVFEGKWLKGRKSV